MPIQHPANFRDVSEALALWQESVPFASGRLLRGGKFDSFTTLEDLGYPKTIINLRQGRDPEHLGVRLIHLPAVDSLENYNTSQPKVRRWIASVLETLCDPSVEWPIYLHCAAGRDRTGVVVAAILLLLDVPAEIVIEEFLLSEGAERATILQAIDGLQRAQCKPLVDANRLKWSICGVT